MIYARSVRPAHSIANFCNIHVAFRYTFSFLEYGCFDLLNPPTVRFMRYFEAEIYHSILETGALTLGAHDIG